MQSNFSSLDKVIAVKGETQFRYGDRSQPQTVIMPRAVCRNVGTVMAFHNSSHYYCVLLSPEDMPHILVRCWSCHSGTMIPSRINDAQCNAIKCCELLNNRYAVKIQLLAKRLLLK
jgi:hypothetical protein